jgi:hypothetical protein
MTRCVAGTARPPAGRPLRVAGCYSVSSSFATAGLVGCGPEVMKHGVTVHIAACDVPSLRPQRCPLERHVGHAVIARIDQETLHLPDLTIEGMNAITALHFCFIQRNDVLDYGLTECGMPMGGSIPPIPVPPTASALATAASADARQLATEMD